MGERLGSIDFFFSSKELEEATGLRFTGCCSKRTDGGIVSDSWVRDLGAVTCGYL
jgi:hypothetical protein